jgi:hypothetical protein
MTNLTTTIDALGAVKAQIADLKIREDELKASLANLDVGNYEAGAFRLSISVHETNRLDLDAVREKLSPQFLRAHTITSEVRTLKVSARNGKKLAA